ncbi:MAG: ABC-2 family transporter protein [Patescibacteria group bacterium]|nr:ABC-2 family transporter protein [Patescibacteria group bacterium]
MYLTLLRISLVEYLSYRLNFVLWRFRMMINIFIPIFLWSSVYQQEPAKREKIIAYFILFHVLYSFVYATRTHEIASQIQSGEIMNLLLKPISFFRYHFVRDLADKFLNLFFSLIEVAIIFWLLKQKQILLKYQVTNWLIFGYLVTVGLLINFFTSVLFSFIGFVSPEYWAPRFLFMITTHLFSGLFVPLDLLPRTLFEFLLYTPFPYFSYWATQVALGQSIEGNFLFKIISLSLFWTGVFFLMMKVLWNKLLQSFSFWGK